MFQKRLEAELEKQIVRRFFFPPEGLGVNRPNVSERRSRLGTEKLELAGGVKGCVKLPAPQLAPQHLDRLRTLLKAGQRGRGLDADVGAGIRQRPSQRAARREQQGTVRLSPYLYNTVEEVEKFRLCSYTEKSQRYITLEKDYVIPEEIKGTGYERQFTDMVREQNEAYFKLFEQLKELVHSAKSRLNQILKSAITAIQASNQFSQVIKEFALCAKKASILKQSNANTASISCFQRQSLLTFLMEQ